MAITWLPNPITEFPPVERAEDDGLLAIGGDLSVESFRKAYQSGIFPWFGNEFPQPLWWAPPSRMVLYPGTHHVSRSNAKALKKSAFTCTVNQCFNELLQKCAETHIEKEGDTWMIPDMLTVYRELYQLGHAMSFEVWRDQELVGGLFGIHFGRVFHAESMFSVVSHASKLAFFTMSAVLQELGFTCVDCQMHTNHLSSLGCVEVDRQTYMEILAERKDWK
ncbi:MAG TPA: leucyl/phenylalanyl-tRNA--protein transferase [Luteibaculaceae bacterium]|nr:leucyl/phenylalanyl-tRNA--protein transferase [Luteibaculaceae bacterium]